MDASPGTGRLSIDSPLPANSDSPGVNMLGIVIAAAVGAVLGVLGAHATVLGGWTLLPWAVAGAIIGYTTRRHPVVAGAAYGFVLAFVFMLDVYAGKASVLSRVPFFALLGVIGAICGAIFAAAGRWLAARAEASQSPSAMPPDEH